jgi:hypothetical protein
MTREDAPCPKPGSLQRLVADVVGYSRLARGDGVNIAARLEGVAKPGAICLSEDAYRQVKQRLDLAVTG